MPYVSQNPFENSIGVTTVSPYQIFTDLEVKQFLGNNGWDTEPHIAGQEFQFFNRTGQAAISIQAEGAAGVRCSILSLAHANNDLLESAQLCSSLGAAKNFLQRVVPKYASYNPFAQMNNENNQMLQ